MTFQPCEDETCADCAAIAAVESLIDRIEQNAEASDNVARANDRIATALAALWGTILAAGLIVVWAVVR